MLEVAKNILPRFSWRALGVGTCLAALGGPAAVASDSFPWLNSLTFGEPLSANNYGNTFQPETTQVEVEQSEDHLRFSWSPETPDKVGAKVDFSFANENGASLLYADRDLWDEDRFARQISSMTGSAGYSDLAYLSVVNSIEDRIERGAEALGFHIGEDFDDRERGQFITSEIMMGLFDDRVRLTRRMNMSRFFTSTSGTAAQNEYEYAYAGDYGEAGHAVLERIDVALWRSENFSLSVYGLRNTVDDAYQTFENRYEDKEADLLEAANRKTFKYGTTLDLGLVGLAFSNFSFDEVEPDDSDPQLSREYGYEAGLSLDLKPVHQRLVHGFGGALSTVLPTSLWVSYGESQVQFEAATTDDRKRDLSYGGTWAWGRGYGSASYWHSVYDGRQSGSEDADWVGNGLDFSAGLNRQKWGIDASLSLEWSRDGNESSATTEQSYDAKIGTWLDFEDAPGFKAWLSLGRYATDDPGHDSSDLSDYLKLGMVLDFDKYLPQWQNDADRGLKLIYGLDYSFNAAESASASERESLTDHTVFLRYTTGL